MEGLSNRSHRPVARGAGASPMTLHRPAGLGDGATGVLAALAKASWRPPSPCGASPWQSSRPLCISPL